MSANACVCSHQLITLMILAVLRSRGTMTGASIAMRMEFSASRMRERQRSDFWPMTVCTATEEMQNVATGMDTLFYWRNASYVVS